MKVTVVSLVVLYCIYYITHCACQTCTLTADMAVVLDASGSIAPTEYEKAKNEIYQMISKLLVQTREAYFAFINYSRTNSLFQTYVTDDYKQNLKILIKSTPYLGRNTATVPALKAVKDKIFNIIRDTKTPKILLLFSDGVNNESINVVKGVADELKAIGIRIFVIKIGSSIDENALNMISSLPLTQYKFDLNQIDALKSSINQITRSECSFDAFN